MLDRRSSTGCGWNPPRSLLHRRTQATTRLHGHATTARHSRDTQNRPPAENWGRIAEGSVHTRANTNDPTVPQTRARPHTRTLSRRTPRRPPPSLTQGNRYSRATREARKREPGSLSRRAAQDRAACAADDAPPDAPLGAGTAKGRDGFGRLRLRLNYGVAYPPSAPRSRVRRSRLPMLGGSLASHSIVRLSGVGSVTCYPFAVTSSRTVTPEHRRRFEPA